MAEKQSSVVQRAFTSVTETVFPGSQSLRHVLKEKNLGSGNSTLIIQVIQHNCLRFYFLLFNLIKEMLQIFFIFTFFRNGTGVWSSVANVFVFQLVFLIVLVFFKHNNARYQGYFDYDCIFM